MGVAPETQSPVDPVLHQASVTASHGEPASPLPMSHRTPSTSVLPVPSAPVYHMAAPQDVAATKTGIWQSDSTLPHSSTATFSSTLATSEFMSGFTEDAKKMGSRSSGIGNTQVPTMNQNNSILGRRSPRVIAPPGGRAPLHS